MITIQAKVSCDSGNCKEETTITICISFLDMQTGTDKSGEWITMPILDMTVQQAPDEWEINLTPRSYSSVIRTYCPKHNGRAPL
jgi:hypothetical protein